MLAIATVVLLSVLSTPAVASAAVTVTTNPNQSETGWDSSQLSGSASISGSLTSLSCSFRYSTDPTLATGVVTVPAGVTCENSAYSAEAYGLDENTTYYYQAQADVNGTEYSGSIVSL